MSLSAEPSVIFSLAHGADVCTRSLLKTLPACRRRFALRDRGRKREKRREGDRRTTEHTHTGSRCRCMGEVRPIGCALG